MATRIRRARRSDFDFIKQLAVESVHFGISRWRDISATEVREVRRQAVQHLEEERANPDLEFLVAYDDETLEQQGYLILNLAYQEPSTGEPESLIEDLAVRPQDRGRYVVNKLVKRAAQLTHQRGLTYMIGEVTLDNQRTLRQALRLGFVSERQQILMRCGEEGAIPWPASPS